MSIEELKNQLEQDRLSLTLMDDGSGVLLDARKEALFSLNPTGLFVVQQIEAGVDEIDVLARAMAERFRIDPEQARRDASDFIRALLETL
jgi:hypothetical protein